MGVASAAAVQLTGVGLSPSILHTAIQNNTGYAIRQSTIDMVPVYQDLTVSGNEWDAVAWSSGFLNRALILDSQQIDGRPFISLPTINVNDGGHLTLSPGTELQMEGARGLWVQSGGTLTAAGTASDPSVLAARDVAAPFVKLGFLPGSAGSLTHFDLSGAGASSSPALQIESSDVSLNHCTIHDNVAGSGAALYLSGAGLSPTIANTTIENNSGRAAHQTTIDMTPVYSNLTFNGNGTDAVVINHGSLNRAVTLDGTQINGSPFIMLQQINIWNGVHLTLAPGTELRMSASKAIYVESGGTFTAEGTASQRVILTAVNPDTPWLKVHTLPGSTTRLSWCDVSRAGASSFPALTIYESDFTLSHCIVHDNAFSGVRLYAGAGSPVLDNLVLIDNVFDGLRVESGVAATIRHATIARNGDDGMHIVNGGSAALTNTIIAGNDTGVHVVSGGSATLTHTLWDGNGQDIDGTVTETGRIVGSAAFDADGYHLTSGSAALQQGADTGVLNDIDGEVRPQPAGTAPDIGADEGGGTPLLSAWDKEIDGQPWEQGFIQTVKIADTIEIVDEITAAPGAPFTLTESWTADKLALVNHVVDPPGTGDVTIGPGTLTWEVANGHPETMTLTKQFRIEPGPWSQITLGESLSGLDVTDPSRNLTFERLAVHDVAVVGVSPSGVLKVERAGRRAGRTA